MTTPQARNVATCQAGPELNSTDRSSSLLLQGTDGGSTRISSRRTGEEPHIGKYRLLKTIGKGNFAKVKLAKHIPTGKEVAIKIIDKTALNPGSLQKVRTDRSYAYRVGRPLVPKVL